MTTDPLPGTETIPPEDTTHAEAEAQTYLDASDGELSDGSSLEDLGYPPPEGEA